MLPFTMLIMLGNTSAQYNTVEILFCLHFSFDLVAHYQVRSQLLWNTCGATVKLENEHFTGINYICVGWYNHKDTSICSVVDASQLA